MLAPSSAAPIFQIFTGFFDMRERLMPFPLPRVQGDVGLSANAFPDELFEAGKLDEGAAPTCAGSGDVRGHHEAIFHVVLDQAERKSAISGGCFQCQPTCLEGLVVHAREDTLLRLVDN